MGKDDEELTVPAVDEVKMPRDMIIDRIKMAPFDVEID